MKNFKTKFFSILGASLLTAGLYSCSNDEMNNLHQEDVKTENSVVVSKPLPPVENEIDEMFYEYVTSYIFIEVRTLLTDFNEDLNFEGFSDEINTSEKLFIWINNNLSTTNFSSVAEAESRWNYLAVRRGVEMSLFPQIYEFYVSASVEDFVGAVSKWFPNQNITTGNSDCEKDLKACNDKASKDYRAYMSWALEHEGAEKEKEVNCADQQHIEDTKVCKKAFDICMEG